MGTAKNKSAGAHFEAVFVHRAALTGIWAHKHALSFRYLRGGKIMPMRSELDFALFNREGDVCFVDTKSFEGKTFARSALDAAQLARAVRYCTHNVPAGFVVLFRALGLVSFFPGWLVQRAPRGTSFGPYDGRVLGRLEAFSLKPVFDEFRAVASVPANKPCLGCACGKRGSDAAG